MSLMELNQMPDLSETQLIELDTVSSLNIISRETLKLHKHRDNLFSKFIAKQNSKQS